MSGPLKIAVAGLGTVANRHPQGAGDPRRSLERLSGRPIVVSAVSARARDKKRPVAVDGFAWYDDAAAMAAEADAEVVVELIGGSDGIAKQVCEAAIANRRHVVTANKALIAEHGTAPRPAPPRRPASACPTRRRWPAAFPSSRPCAKVWRRTA